MGGPARSPRPRTSCGPCPAASRPASSRAAPTCPAASASASRSPGRSCASPTIYLFDDSFSALDLATDARLRTALRPYTARRRRRDRRPAGVDDHHRRRDPRPRGRRARRPRHPRGAARDVPDLRRDRRSRRSVSGSRGMTVTDGNDAAPSRRPSPTNEELREITGRRRAATRAAGAGTPAGVPTERSAKFGAVRAAALRAARPRAAPARRSSSSCAVGSAALNVLGPRVLGQATDIIIKGIYGAGGIDFGRAPPHPRRWPSACTSTRRRCCGSFTAWMITGVVQRTHAAACGRRPRPRSTPCRCSYIDQQAARRPAQPRHQRPRQPGPEPPADAEPDADVGAAAHRRGHR